MSVTALDLRVLPRYGVGMETLTGTAQNPTLTITEGRHALVVTLSEAERYADEACARVRRLQAAGRLRAAQNATPVATAWVQRARRLRHAAA